MIDFKLVTPDGVVYESDIDSVTLPTQAGEITLLERHAPLVSVLKPGEIIVKKDAGQQRVAMAVSGGIVEVRPDSRVYVMADTAERAEEIDVARAEEARKRAEQLLKEKENTADVDFARLQAQIEKELARISVGTKYRNI